MAVSGDGIMTQWWHMVHSGVMHTDVHCRAAVVCVMVAHTLRWTPLHYFMSARNRPDHVPVLLSRCLHLTVEHTAADCHM